jgi:hypothetical protein
MLNYLSELLMRITLLSSRSDPNSCNNAGTGIAENNWVRSRSSSRESRGLRTTVVTILHTGPAKAKPHAVTYSGFNKVTDYFSVCPQHCHLKD